MSRHSSHDQTPAPALSHPIHAAPIHAHWAEAARVKGFDVIARVKDRLHLALRCRICGGILTARHSVVMTAQPLCPHCIETRWRETARAASLAWPGYGSPPLRPLSPALQP